MPIVTPTPPTPGWTATAVQALDRFDRLVQRTEVPPPAALSCFSRLRGAVHVVELVRVDPGVLRPVHRVADPSLPKFRVQPALELGEPVVVDHPELEDRRDRLVLGEAQCRLRGAAEPDLVDRGQPHVPGHLRGHLGAASEGAERIRLLPCHWNLRARAVYCGL
jgi:hypothetical protein